MGSSYSITILDRNGKKIGELMTATRSDIMKFINKGFTVVGQYIGARVPVDIRCSNEHIWSVRPTNLFSHNSGCPYSKLHTTLRTHSISNRNNHIQIIKIGWLCRKFGISELFSTSNHPHIPHKVVYFFYYSFVIYNTVIHVLTILMTFYSKNMIL